MKYKRLLLYVLFCIALIILSLAFTNKTTAQADISPVQVNSDPLFEKIGWCESRNDPHAKNSTSSATGRFQFLWGTWYHYGKELWGDEFYNKNIWSYKDNTELAWYAYSKYGTGDWDASIDCWIATSMFLKYN